MGEGAWLVAFLLAQRLAELVFAQSNTARLRAKGAVEFGAAHYPLMILLHASWLIGLVGVRPRPAHRLVVVCAFRSVAVRSPLGDRKPRSTVDHAGNRIAWRGAGHSRSLSVDQASELPDCRAGNRRGSAGARVARVRADLFHRECGAARLPHSHRERSAGLGRADGMSQRRQPLPITDQTDSYAAVPAGRFSAAESAPVAQLDRAPDYESGGQGFESLRARQHLSVANSRISCSIIFSSRCVYGGSNLEAACSISGKKFSRLML